MNGDGKIRIDLHIHSMYSSDGVLEPLEIVRIAKERGLSGIAVTDHNTIRGGHEAKKYETKDFKVIIGSEIMTEKGEITGLFLSKEIESRHFQDVISEIKAQGGIVIVPHPFDGLRRSAFHITGKYAGSADAIEGFNSRCILRRYNKKAVEFATQYNLPIVGGSDAHYANEIGLGGVISQSDDIRKAIMENNLTLFGKRSPIISHVRTKARKLCRKIVK
ncbi:PHP domain-containing protein [Chloroflexota bacterium]